MSSRRAKRKSLPVHHLERSVTEVVQALGYHVFAAKVFSLFFVETRCHQIHIPIEVTAKGSRKRSKYPQKFDRPAK